VFAGLDGSRSIALTKAFVVVSLFFGVFVAIIWKMTLSGTGRLELEFGGIDCEFGESVRLLQLLLISVTTFFHDLD